MKLRYPFVCALALSSLGVFSACGMPGNVLGIYAVNGTIQNNTCGLGLQAPSPWNFNVELSEQVSTLYWNTMDGSPLLSGQVAAGAVSMDNTTSGAVDSAPDGAPGPCTMARYDQLALTLSGGATPQTFTGTLTYTFSVVAGSDCSDQMSSAGGTYDALPCTVSYNLAGAYSQPGQ
jgi:hypothetical protein